MKKLGTLVSILCIVNILMLAGVVGFLLATGRLDKPKAQAISDMLKHQGSPEGLRAKVYDIMAPATQTQPATSTSPGTRLDLTGADTPATAQERIDYVQKLLEQERLRLDAEAQKQQQERESLERQARNLEKASVDLATREKAYQEKLASAGSQSDAAGFAKSMSIFNQLKPKQIKDLLVDMPADDISRYLSAMEPDQAAKVIAEFKSPTEKQVMNTALDKLRGVKDASGTGAASGTSVASQPTVAASAGKAGP